ncbi:hypothetical protein C0J52_25080 [Blattella germanica]|nr:hypothetical protein C0J52_25080 [Blattella germanica]
MEALRLKFKKVALASGAEEKLSLLLRCQCTLCAHDTYKGELEFELRNKFLRRLSPKEMAISKENVTTSEEP